MVENGQIPDIFWRWSWKGLLIDWLRVEEKEDA